MYAVCPFGERRADLRSAFHTANVIAAQAGKEVSDVQFQEMVESLESYLKCDVPTEDEDVNEIALARIKGE